MSKSGHPRSRVGPVLTGWVPPGAAAVALWPLTSQSRGHSPRPRNGRWAGWGVWRSGTSCWPTGGEGLEFKYPDSPKLMQEWLWDRRGSGSRRVSVKCQQPAETAALWETRSSAQRRKPGWSVFGLLLSWMTVNASRSWGDKRGQERNLGRVWVEGPEESGAPGGRRGGARGWGLQGHLLEPWSLPLGWQKTKPLKHELLCLELFWL